MACTPSLLVLKGIQLLVQRILKNSISLNPPCMQNGEVLVESLTFPTMVACKQYFQSKLDEYNTDLFLRVS